MTRRRQALAELDVVTVRLRDGVEAMARKLRAVERDVFPDRAGAR